MHREEQILNCNMPDTEDGVGYENEDKETVAMIEEAPLGGGTITNPLGTHFTLFFSSQNKYQYNLSCYR